MDRRQRLPKFDRCGTAGDVTMQILGDFQPQGRLSPVVPREESERVLRRWRVWGSLQTRGVTGGREGVMADSRGVLA